MAWRTFAIAPRRKMVATAVIYGLSLAVRFTSAAGEETEIPAKPPQRAHPMISIMVGNGAQLPYQDWGPKSAQPIVFRHGWPPSSATPGCSPP
jgi:hypothetical protein